MKIFYKLLTIFGVAEIESYKTTRKSIYDVFNSYSLCYQVKLNLLPYIYFTMNGLLVQVVQFWSIHTIPSIFILTKIFHFFAMFSLRWNHNRSNSQRINCDDTYR